MTPPAAERQTPAEQTFEAGLGKAVGADSTSSLRLPNGAQRILLYGVTGSGKSTLALRLGELTGITTHLVDEEIGWLPNWQERPVDEQRQIASRLAAEDRWIFDSAYGKFRDLVVPRAELVIGLDYSRLRTLTQLIRRTLRRVRTRELVCNGNVEVLGKVFTKDSILGWHFKSFSRKRQTMRDLAAQAAMDSAAPRVLLFRNPAQTADWLASLNR